MPTRSAGLLLHRRTARGLEVLLVHPGGPFWRNKDVGAWQIPKGIVEPGEDDETAALREVAEELGIKVGGRLIPLSEIRQAGGRPWWPTPPSAILIPSRLQATGSRSNDRPAAVAR